MSFLNMNRKDKLHYAARARSALSLRLTVLAFSSLLLGGCGQGEFDGSNKLLDTVILQDSTGQAHPLKDMRGKWVVLNFWASWCKPCRQEIPELNRFFQASQGKVEVYGVGMDPNDAKQADTLREQFSIEYPLVFESVAEKLNISVNYLPTTVFINPEGKIIKAEVREQSYDSLLKVVS